MKENNEKPHRVLAISCAVLAFTGLFNLVVDQLQYRNIQNRIDVLYQKVEYQREIQEALDLTEQLSNLLDRLKTESDQK